MRDFLEKNVGKKGWNGKRIPRNSSPVLTLDQLHHFQVGAVVHHRPIHLEKQGKELEKNGNFLGNFREKGFGEC